MPASKTIPVFDPQGNLRDVPEDQLAAAVKSGGTPSVRFRDPQGKIRYVPANRTQEATAAGGQMLPLEQQDISHEGAWKALGHDIWGAVKSTPQLLTQFSSDPATMARNMKANQERAGAMVENLDTEKNEGHGLPYRAGSVIAQTAGVNVPGMEESARQGDIGGVLGHAAAVPVMLGAGEGLARTVPKVAPPVVRTVARGVNTALEHAPGIVGAAAGETIGHPILGYGVGRAILPKLRIPGERFGLPEASAAGYERYAPNTGAPAASGEAPPIARVPYGQPEAATRALPELDATAENKPFAGAPKPKGEVLDATGENKAFAGGMDEYTEPKEKLENTGKIPSPSETAQQIRFYRARSVGEEGVPYHPESHAQGTASLDEAQNRIAPFRAEQESAPQEIISGDLSQTPGFSVRRGPNGPNWYKFYSDIPESQVTRIAPPNEVPGATLGESPDPLLEQLRTHAANIQREQAAPGAPEEDLSELGARSVAQAKATRGLGEPSETTPAETEDEFKARLAAKADAMRARGEEPNVARGLGER